MNARAMKRLQLGLPGDPLILAGNFTATIDLHERIIVLNAATMTVTLPRANGSGTYLEFCLGIAAVSMIIKRGISTDVIRGNIFVGIDNSTSGKSFASASTSNTITLNGSTTGGANIGDSLVLVDQQAGVWSVAASIIGSGGIATPFSNT